MESDVATDSGARFRPAGDPGGWTTTRWGHRVFDRGHQCLGAASCRAQDRARLLQLGGETGRDLVLAAMPRASRRRAASRGNGEFIFLTVGPMAVLGPRVGDLNGWPRLRWLMGYVRMWFG